MAKRPSLQFYPADWAGNANLKRCTFEEKGIWVDVMCLMHDQPEYGVLRWPLDEIAEAVKCKPTSLRAIARKNVIKGSDTAIEDFIYVPRSGRKDGDPVILIAAQDGPIWFSSRMVTDEYVRNHAGASTRFGARQSKESPGTMPADSDSPSRAPSHRQGDTKPRQGERLGEYQGDGSSSSSSSSSSSVSESSPLNSRVSVLPTSGNARAEGRRGGKEFDERHHHEQFELVKAAYPKRAGREDWLQAEHACRLRIDEGETWEGLLAGVQRYAAYVRAKNDEGTQFVMAPGKFFSAVDRPWAQPWTPPASKAEQRLHGNVSAAAEAKRQLLKESQ